jgi:site-specific recombinase XerD
MPLPPPIPLFDRLAFSDPKQAENMLVQHAQQLSFAGQDYQHALQFLYSYRGSDATFNAYRREIERLLQWISQKALQAIFAICGSFYNYLIQEDYMSFNPVAQIRQKSKFIRQQKTKMIIRRLSELQWSYVIETVEMLAARFPKQHERSLFIMKALYGMYLRVSELAASMRWEPQMGHFQKDADGNWWFMTVGKGNKERLISVSDEMLKALKRYRQSLSLTPLPSRGETIPLICKSIGNGPITSTRQIRSIVQTCFDAAFERMVNDGLQEEAIELKTATVHWLRHTGISEDVKHRPREHVRDDAGHSSSAITDKYIDVEMRARHASAKKKKLDPLA